MKEQKKTKSKFTGNYSNEDSRPFFRWNNKTQTYNRFLQFFPMKVFD